MTASHTHSTDTITTILVLYEECTLNNKSNISDSTRWVPILDIMRHIILHYKTNSRIISRIIRLELVVDYQPDYQLNYQPDYQNQPGSTEVPAW